MSKYDDIINYPHPVSKKHKPMSLEARAAQFAPFAALVGYDDVIVETGRQTNERIKLSEDQASHINELLIYLIENKDVTATFTFFKEDEYKQGGAYISVTGNIKKADIDNQKLILEDKTVIDINSITSILI